MYINPHGISLDDLNTLEYDPSADHGPPRFLRMVRSLLLDLGYPDKTCQGDVILLDTNHWPSHCSYHWHACGLFLHLVPLLSSIQLVICRFWKLRESAEGLRNLKLPLRVQLSAITLRANALGEVF